MSAITETGLNNLAQKFYETSGLARLQATDKPKVVKGLRAVLEAAGVRIAQPMPDADAIAMDVDGDVWVHDNGDSWYCQAAREFRPWDEIASRAPLKIYRPEESK